MTKEQAMALKVGDKVHHSFFTADGHTCEGWTVAKAYWEYLDGWSVRLRRGAYSHFGISEANLNDWHLPSECPRTGSGHD